MEQPNDNANNKKQEPDPDHQNAVVSRNDSSLESKHGADESPMAPDSNNKMRKSVHWSEELVMESESHSPPREMQSSSSSFVGAESNPYVAYSPAPSNSPSIFKS